MRAQEFANTKLVIFDIDDTLVNTDTKVGVVRDGRVVRQLNSHDFTHYQLRPGESFDFGAFRDAQEFFRKAKPIAPMIAQLRHDIATGNKVIMVTARADFDDREVFLDTFRKYGVDMDRVHVYRAGNIGLKVPTEEKKKMIIRRVMGQDHYDKVIMYDDAEPNLQAFMSLAPEYPWSRFYAWHVDRGGRASEYHRSNIKEATGSSAAGVVLYAEDTGRWGFQQRSDTVNDPGLWAAWGGGREPGESTEQCALRELAEESGYCGPIKLEALDQNPDFMTFVGRVPAEFEPRYNPEWKDYCWVDAGNWPQPMHPGMAMALENLGQGQTIVEDNVLHLRDWTVTVSPHALERTYQRGINAKAVDRILKNFAQIKSHIAGIEPGQPFIVHDQAGTALGMRRLVGNRLILATVYQTNNDFERGRYPTFAVSVSTNESQTAKTGIMQTDVYGSRAYHARCLEPGCDWESRRYDRIQQAQAAAKKHAATHFDKKAVAEGVENDDTAISLSRLGRFHKGQDTLAEFVPERATARYALHPDKWESTFFSLTNKDPRKLKYFGPKKIAIPPGTLVGDMAIANRFYRAETEEEKQKYAEEYRQSLKPYPVDIGQYRMPELLIPREGVAEGTNNIAYKQQKGKNKFSIEMSVDGKSAGIFQYDANTGRTIVELDPAFRGQGLGQRLILKGIYTAAMLGMDYVEDESRTAMLDRAMDSLADAGYIVNDNEYWYVTSSGEQFLRQAVAEGRDFDRCYDKACQLYDKAQEKNLQPKLVQVADFQGDGSKADQRWTKLPQHVWQHYVVIVGDQVLDPTARQFGPDMPTQYHVSDLDRLWGKQYKIRPREGVEENFADGRKPGRRGMAKRVGVNCKQPVSKLRSIAKNSSGERQRMAHWCANMKSGRKK